MWRGDRRLLVEAEHTLGHLLLLNRGGSVFGRVLGISTKWLLTGHYAESVQGTVYITDGNYNKLPLCVLFFFIVLCWCERRVLYVRSPVATFVFVIPPLFMCR